MIHALPIVKLGFIATGYELPLLHHKDVNVFVRLFTTNVLVFADPHFSLQAPVGGWLPSTVLYDLRSEETSPAQILIRTGLQS